ncbi:Radical SAM superfamily protein [Treponema bryantii]|uniref:Radical SAM superfamily protein n=1 Tax=Treponema bryantii TaxID=163 RepID=A0A1H9C4A4_9SPIR|nr:radical SAM protein [Treponema bryantii]SEP95797.1 Radical SAM superfamily protein [Treponema bryantii]
MKTLFLLPPSVPFYFNEGHRLLSWEVAQYMRKHTDSEVKCLDAGVLNFTYKDLLLELSNKYDLVCIQVEFDNINSLNNTIGIIKNVCRKTKVLLFGRVTVLYTKQFLQLNPDAILFSGDPESGIVGYYNSLKSNEEKATPGICTLRNGEYIFGENGEFIDQKDLEFPKIEEIPLKDYDRMYSNSKLKFSGIAGKRELTIPIGRGCPNNCSFCHIPKYQGLRDRRHSIESIIDYIKEIKNKIPFDYLSFYCPTFVLKKEWNMAFSKALIDQKMNIKWKACTELYFLDKELLETFKKSGCLRISIGLEVLTKKENLLNKHKTNQEEKLLEISKICKDLDIELNCFVIIGLPGSSIADLKYTFEILNTNNISYRQTLYSDFNNTDIDIFKNEYKLNRMYLSEDDFTDSEIEELYDLYLRK